MFQVSRTSFIELNTKKSIAKFAGLIYFVLAITAMYGYLYVPSQIFVSGSAKETAESILANEWLFRSGRVSYLFSTVLIIPLVMLLYRLFKPVDKNQANLMVAFVLVGVPITFVAEAFNFISLAVLKGETLPSLSDVEVREMAHLCRKMYSYGLTVAGVFYGLWLLPFGRLVYQSGFIPRIFGVLLILGCVGYVLESLDALLLPQGNYFLGMIAMILYSPGEILIIFWLLIKGVNEPKLATQSEYKYL